MKRSYPSTIDRSISIESSPTSPVVREILHRLDAVTDEKRYVERIFGPHAEDALHGRPVVLLGAGALGYELHLTLSLHGVSPACFCDNDASKVGETFCNKPIISFDELNKSHKQSLLVIATQIYAGEVTRQLEDSGFDADLIFVKKKDADTNLLRMYATVGTQNILAGHKPPAGKSGIDILVENNDRITEAHALLADQRSKDLFVSKLALLASGGSIELFKEFMLSFSEPIREFGFFGYDGTPEDHFYFNNDVIKLEQNEVYIDVGAYDGDTVMTFIEALRNRNLDYRRIYAFEPDPVCFDALQKNTAGFPNVSLRKQGLWSETKTLRFVSSGMAQHDQSGIIDDSGDIEVDAIRLDDFIDTLNDSSGDEERITFIKMDPGGNVIPQALQGAVQTIETHKPKLALGAYHAFESIFEIPLLVREINPGYKLYLRHNTYHLCDTALYAVQE